MVIYHTLSKLLREHLNLVLFLAVVLKDFDQNVGSETPHAFVNV